MARKFQLPDNAQPGDAVLAHCPVCNELVYILILPGSEQYSLQVMRQMEDALSAHVSQTGHDSLARRNAKAQRGGSAGGGDGDGR